MSDAFQDLASLPHLLAAFECAAAGKRRKPDVAAFEFRLIDNLLELRDELLTGTYRPGLYRHFFVHEPKRRKISATSFRDRVVHHALCMIIEPRFERLFIADSYANRIGKGTHRAIDRLQQFVRAYRYALRLDLRQFFASIDHEVLLEILRRRIPETDLIGLVEQVLAGGSGAHDGEYEMVWFPGDDLLAACRPRGLPIGNLTSQFWANCLMHPFDQFVRRELGCAAYLRYVDDFVLFADRKATLWEWKRAVTARLAVLRLTIHDASGQIVPTGTGIPWLGFVVYPEHRLVKARKVRHATRRLSDRYEQFAVGRIGRDAFVASVHGWINHVRHADSWGLRAHVLSHLSPAGE